VHGLLALCELTAARFPARTGPDGAPILLEDQDRRRWDFSAIRRGLAALVKASARGLGPYGLQAAIAAAHASAPSVEATDWDRIVVLYKALGDFAVASRVRRLVLAISGCRHPSRPRAGP
jgi:predicted RNA polymerase sigma factor